MPGNPRRRLAVFVGVLVLALAVVCVQPVLAAIQLSFFTVTSYPTYVVLEWGTASEYNTAGFEVQCKKATAPELDYHNIGYVPAHGGQNLYAVYTFPVTSGMEPGEAYCFRLKEETTDGTDGDVIDRCGYGPNVTPTPGAPGIVATFAPTLTIPTATPSQPLVPGAVPDQPVVPGQPVVPAAVQPQPAFPTQPIMPAAVPTPSPVSPQPVLPTVPPAQPISPLPPPQVEAPQAAPAVAVDPSLQAAAVPVPNVESPMAAAVSADQSQLVPPLPVDPNSAAALADVPPAPVDLAASALQYVVVTATPTQAPVALAPAMTPLPTVTPTPNAYDLVNVLEPTAQNAMVMLLCLTFTGASVIGILGLLTTTMYLRARSSQRDYFDRYSGRRRI